MLYENNYPISDDKMIYDYDAHMYILKADYIKQRTGIDLTLFINSPYIVDKTTAVNNMLRDISVQVYLYVYNSNINQKYYKEYLMAKSILARENIREALMKQLSYVIRNGKIDEFVGMNVSYNDEKAKNSLEDLRGDRSIHPEAIQFLDIPLENGEKLLYNGTYNIPHGIKIREGY